MPRRPYGVKLMRRSMPACRNCVTFMDSSGVGLILGRGRQMSGLGGRLVVQNAPDTVRRMLDLAHIHYV